MDQKKITRMIKNCIMVFFVFMTGFIGTMVLVSKRVTDMLSTLVEAEAEITDSISFLGFELVKFVCLEKDGSLSVDIIQSSLYRYMPFISGFVLLFICLIFTLIIKRILKKKVN